MKLMPEVQPVYTLDDKQLDMEKTYRGMVTLLSKAGYKVKYNRLWVSGPDDPVGYITLEG